MCLRACACIKCLLLHLHMLDTVPPFSHRVPTSTQNSTELFYDIIRQSSGAKALPIELTSAHFVRRTSIYMDLGVLLLCLAAVVSGTDLIEKAAKLFQSSQRTQVSATVHNTCRLMNGALVTGAVFLLYPCMHSGTWVGGHCFSFASIPYKFLLTQINKSNRALSQYCSQ